MAQLNISFMLEAATLDDAKAAVGESMVTPDTTLIGITGTVSALDAPIEIPDGGQISDVIEAPPPEDAKA